MAHSADAEYQHFSPGGIIATSGECLWGGGGDTQWGSGEEITFLDH